MGRDAGGHGHDPGEPGNPNHGPHGYFSDGGGDGGGKGGSGGKKQAWSTPHVSLDKKATKERHAVAQAKQMKEAAKFKEAKAEDKQFDKTRGAERRAADKEDRARDRAAAKADHQAAQQHDGHGSPIRMHAGAPSVGTHSGGAVGSGGGGLTSGSGGGGGGIGAKLSKLASAKPKSKTTGLRQSAKEGVARGQMIDSSHFPSGVMTQPVVAGYRSGGRR
jgi:hypothetical protein